MLAARLAAWLALRLRQALIALFLLVSLWPLAAPAADDFLDPLKAFRFSARAVAPDAVEVQFDIHPGYYLYREPLRFNAAGASLGAADIPDGKVKFDENFGKNVETYRGQLRLRLPVEPARAVFELQVVSQGCADAGLCYPPMTSLAKIDLAAFGGAANAIRGSSATSAASPDAADGLTWAQRLSPERVLQSGAWLGTVAAFFAMGLLLSLTPCVLPMLPILSSLILGQGQSPSRARGLALAGSYSLGMALIYTSLGVVAGLAGEGMAAFLQQPWVLGLFALLLAGFALAMFDVYELKLPTGLATALTTRCNRISGGRLAGVFVMGGLSALIVSPCVTAPLAGALLFISQSRDVLLGGSALFAMTVGMSVPLLLLGASAQRWVPRSGGWMNAVKRFFGVLLLAVAVYVLQPALPPAMALGAWGLLLLLLGFMLAPFEPGRHAQALGAWLRRAGGVAALTLGVLQLVGAAAGASDPLRPLAPLVGQRLAVNAGAPPAFRLIHTSAELDLALGQAGRPVMLDFYADWCVSCREMERFTFSQPEVVQRMAGALLLKADVTANNADDRALLKRFALFGPPGTLFFDARGQEVAAARVIGFQGPQQFLKTLAAAGL